MKKIIILFIFIIIAILLYLTAPANLVSKDRKDKKGKDKKIIYIKSEIKGRKGMLN